MRTFKRICLQDHTVEDDGWPILELKRGQEYITSAVDEGPAMGPRPAESGHVIVFSGYWASVPVSIFGGEVVFTEE